MNRRDLMLAMGALGLTPAMLATAANAQQGAASAAAPDGKAVARDAWLYALPLIEMATTRARHLGMGAPVNRLVHGRKLADHTRHDVTTPNNDTLYSFAWTDLTKGPVTLTVPEMDERYWSVAVMDMFTNNNAILGTRTVGAQGGTFTLAGPGQAGVGDIVRVATPHAWVLARVVVDGEADLPAVHALQARFKLEAPAGEKPGPYAERNADPAAYFDSARRLLASEGFPATDLRVLRRCSALLTGSGAGADSPDVAAGIAQAKAIAKMGMGAQSFIQGWSYPRANLGDYGQDYLYRALVALAGLGALTPAEAMYMRAEGDGNAVFTGDNSWRLSLPAQMPLDAFWSLSMYEQTADGQFFFTDNPLKRYAIGDRTPGLKRNADGGVDLWISRTDPGGDRTANWLPAPKAGPYGAFMRMYLPRTELLDGRWRLPAMVKV